jgi:hypothetical protein
VIGSTFLERQDGRFIRNRSVRNQAYGALAVPAVQSSGGRFLTGSTSQVRAHEAGLPQRTIIVELDSYDIALAPQ